MAIKLVMTVPIDVIKEAKLNEAGGSLKSWKQEGIMRRKIIRFAIRAQLRPEDTLIINNVGTENMIPKITALKNSIL